MRETLYMKIDRNHEVNHTDVRLGDVAKLVCTSEEIKECLKNMQILKIQAEKSERYIFSVLKVIEQIHGLYPELEIHNLGETDFIIEYESGTYAVGRWNYLKVAVVCLIIFFGSAFSIMAFNNDVGAPQVFQQVYERMMGEPADGFTVLEATYSIGIAVGIIVFYNHFGGRRLTEDPTPMEVQMRLYEDDVNTTLVESSSREGKSVDVD